MSNNNKQPPDLTESLPISDNAQAPSTTIQTVKKNDSLGISGINQADVDESEDQSIGFLLGCAERGQILSNQHPPSICKVSRIFRELSESSFTPQLVSIGPIHREDPKLQEFEWLKKYYLHDLLKRFRSRSTPKEILEACLLKVNDLIPQIRESYAGIIENYNDFELATMMVMDGCFILQFCFKHEYRNLNFPNKMHALSIAMDLMLLENQIPFVVLQALFDCSMGKVSFTLSNVLYGGLAPYITLFGQSAEKNSIHSNVLYKYLAPYIKLFCSLLPEKISTADIDSDLSEKSSTTDVDSDSTHDHVLGYMHKRYKLLVVAKSSDPPEAFHSMVELDRSGMKFKPHQEGEWSMTIKFQSSLFSCLPWFWSKPTLLMPTLVLDDTTELILRNFIAYEQSFPHGRYYFTSYARAMHMLNDTQEDIAKLIESKVLVNMLGTNQEAADMINKVCRNISITDFYYTQAFRQMDKYYNSYWPMIKRTYFSNPWNAINLLVGIIVFLATVVSAIFAILQYFG